MLDRRSLLLGRHGRGAGDGVGYGGRFGNEFGFDFVLCDVWILFLFAWIANYLSRV